MAIYSQTRLPAGIVAAVPAFIKKAYSSTDNALVIHLMYTHNDDLVFGLCVLILMLWCYIDGISIHLKMNLAIAQDF